MRSSINDIISAIEMVRVWHNRHRAHYYVKTHVILESHCVVCIARCIEAWLIIETSSQHKLKDGWLAAWDKTHHTDRNDITVPAVRAKTWTMKTRRLLLCEIRVTFMVALFWYSSRHKCRNISVWVLVLIGKSSAVIFCWIRLADQLERMSFYSAKNRLWIVQLNLTRQIFVENKNLKRKNSLAMCSAVGLKCGCNITIHNKQITFTEYSSPLKLTFHSKCRGAIKHCKEESMLWLGWTMSFESSPEALPFTR